MKAFQLMPRQTKSRRAAINKSASEYLQRSHLQEVLGYPVQTKLKVGSPDDVQEREADAVADKVMASEDETIQRKCTQCAQEEPEKQDAPEAEPEEVQRKETAAAPAASGASLPAGRGGGQPLASSHRAFFEPRLGTNLGQVRVHADGEAARLSAGLAARAFTVGSDVYFGAGEYQPYSNTGRRLIAHELAHVMQQRGEEPTVRRELLTVHAQRPGPGTSTGHAFVTMEDAQGVKRGWGLYPAYVECGRRMLTDGEALHILAWNVPGEVCNDVNHEDDAKVDYQINAAAYQRAATYADRKQASPPPYDFFFHSCVHFAREVAEVAGVTVPDLPGVDEPEDLAAHLREEIQQRQDIEDRDFLRSSALRLIGPATVDLNGGDAQFDIQGLPRGHRIRFRWVIADADDRRYLMRGARGGVPFHYSDQSSALIGEATRQLLRERRIRDATVQCRVASGVGRALETSILYSQPVSFTW